MDGYHVGICAPISNVHYSSRPDTRSQQSFQHHSNQKIAATEFAKKKYAVSFFFSDHGTDKKERDVILFWKNDAQGHARVLYHGESRDKIRKEK